MGTIKNGGMVTIENPDFCRWIDVAEGRIDEVKISCLFKDSNSGKIGKITIAIKEIILDQTDEFNWELIGFIEIKNAPVKISISYSETKKEAWYAITPKNKGGNRPDDEDLRNFFGKDWPF